MRNIVISDWYTFFPNKTDPEESHTYKNEEFNMTYPLPTLSSGSFWILNCYFEQVNEKKEGSCIKAHGTDDILIEQSSFCNCTASSRGCIYIIGKNAVLNKVCGYHCIVESGPCSFCDIQYGSPDFKYIYYSCISRCETQNDWFAMFIDNGEIQMKNLNFSYNKANQVSTIYCLPKKKLNFEHMCDIKFSSFYSNEATQDKTCIKLSSNSAVEMSHSNVIKNSGKDLLIIKGYMKINHCSILKNSGSPVLSREDGDSLFIIEKSIIDDDSKNDFSPDSVSSFVNELSFISTGSCEGRYYIVIWVEQRNEESNIKVKCSNMLPFKIIHKCTTFLISLALTTK